jgi:hypothetical protein
MGTLDVGAAVISGVYDRFDQASAIIEQMEEALRSGETDDLELPVHGADLAAQLFGATPGLHQAAYALADYLSLSEEERELYQRFGVLTDEMITNPPAQLMALLELARTAIDLACSIAQRVHQVMP